MWQAAFFSVVGGAAMSCHLTAQERKLTVTCHSIIPKFCGSFVSILKFGVHFSSVVDLE
jgi:hypothetical protein